MAQNCCQARQVKSNNRDAPAGVATYNVEVALEDSEALRQLAEPTVAIGEVYLNSVEFDYSMLPSLWPAWELIAQDFAGQIAPTVGPVSMGEASEHDFEDVWDNMPSLQSVSDTLSDLTECDKDIMSRLHAVSDTSLSSDGACPIPVKDDGIWVSKVDWDELQFPRTRAEGARPYTFGNAYE